MSWMINTYKKQPWVLLLLAAPLAVLLSVLSQANGGVLGNAYHYWLTWWPWQAFTQNFDLISNNFLFFPAESNHLLHISPSTGVIFGLLALPLPPELAYHLTLFGLLLLNVFVAYQYLRDERPAGQAMLLALVMTFNPLTYTFAAQGQFGLMAFFPLLLVMTCLRALFRQHRTRDAVLLALSLYLVILTSLQYLNLLIIVLVPLIAANVWRQKERAAALEGLAITFILFMLLFAVYPGPGMMWSTYSVQYPAPLAPGSTVIEAGFITLLLAYAALSFISGLYLLSKKQFMAVPWMVIAVLGVLLYLMPAWGPSSLIDQIFRVPNAFTLTNPTLYLMAAVIGGTALNSLAAQQISRDHRHQRTIAVVLGVVAIIGFTSWLRPFTFMPPDHRLDDFYATLTQENERYAVLQMPVITEESATPSDMTIPQLHAPRHGKRIIGGILPEYRPEHAAAFENSDLLALAAGLPVDQPDAQSIWNDTTRLRIGYAILPNDDTSRQLRSWLAWTGAFCQRQMLDDVTVWRAWWHPEGCGNQTLDLGAGYDELAVVSGWVEAAVQDDASVRTVEDEQTELRLWAAPAYDPDAIELRVYSKSSTVVAVQVNGTALDDLRLAVGWGDYQIALDDVEIEPDRILRITLTHSASVSYDRVTMLSR